MYALCFWGYGVGKSLFAKEDTFTVCGGAVAAQTSWPASQRNMFSMCRGAHFVCVFYFPPQNHTPENLVRIGLAGATSAIFTTPVLCPSERIKCVIQV
jgi:hypothetical protein